MIEILVRLKRNFPFLWSWIEYLNGFLFGFFYEKSMVIALREKSSSYSKGGLSYRLLRESDIDSLVLFLAKQDKSQFAFFKPHEFDQKTLNRLFKNPAFIMLGVFHDDALVGYFFLRCFFNKKSFTGRIVDHGYQGKGIAKNMGRILIESAWAVGFRVFGTASKSNESSLGSYRSINNFKIIKELNGDYIYFEYMKPQENSPNSSV